ncbi:MAG: hypothetical protein WBZ37_07850 [Mycobacterium sp.]
MQLALSSDLSGQGLRAGSRKFMAAGVAVIGASLIAANPLAPNVAADIDHRIAVEVQHRAVQLTSGGSDVIGAYEDLFSQTGANLQVLGSEAGVAFPSLLNQIGANLQGTGGILQTAITGTQAGLTNALYNGWYGSDDGFVFGLIGGTLTHNGVSQSGSTITEIVNSLSQGNVFNAFGYFDEWSLEAVEHVTKPLLSPLLSTAKVGATPSPTLINTFLQTLLNLDNGLLTFANVKSLADAVLAPPISFAFGALAQGGKIGGDLAAMNIAGALADVAKTPAALAGDLLNGYVYPGAYNPTGLPFTGLLNNGSILQELLYTWPNQLASALGAPATSPATSAAASSVAASLSSGLAHVTSLLPNLSQLAAQPALLAANLGANLSAALSPMLANIAAQLSATLAPNLISGLLLHLPALILAML